MATSHHLPLIVRQDLDGFFGLFVDNLVQLLLIAALCGSLCGMHGADASLLYGRVLPGAALSIVFGNFFYAWQARRLAQREQRRDVTALPFGINTPSLLVFVFFVIAPVYQSTGDARAAWRMGLVACAGSGLIQFLGAFIAERIRRHTPRAAMLASLSGIAIGFISMTFMLQMWQHPIVALPPLALLLMHYLGRTRIRGVPGGLGAIVLGTALAWLLPAGLTGLELHAGSLAREWDNLAFYPPIAAVHELFAGLRQEGVAWTSYLSVIIPMGLFDLVGSLQNIESAEAAGDRYGTRSSLAVNGLATLAAACCGSCFPTTIYIGHPAWKALGARSGYSVLNALAVAVICFTGGVVLTAQMVPLEACIGIVLWIGVIITAQAFIASPARHAPAVALGLFPAIAAWGASLVSGAVILAGGNNGMTMQTILAGDINAQAGGFLIHAMNLLQQGYLFTSMILAAAVVQVIDRRFFAAAAWLAAGALLTLLGLIHAYQISGNSVYFLLRGTDPMPNALAFPALGAAAGYLVLAAIFAVVGAVQHTQWIRTEGGEED